MSRRSLRPHLNQVRTWVRQGRTDAWIAHQLEATVQQIDAFKRENDLAPADEAAAGATTPNFDEEIDLRAEDDAKIAAELEAAEAARAEEAARQAEEDARAAEEAAARKAAGLDVDADDADDAEGGARPRRRGRRGGRSRRGAKTGQTSFEGTFDHGEEGYGLWLDPDVADAAVYAEHWAGHRPVEVIVEADQIIIRRAGEAAGGDDDAAAA